MTSETTSIQSADRIAAYQIVLENMPEQERWTGALSLREGSLDPAKVFAVLDGIRQELYIRIGDLAADNCVNPYPDLTPPSSTNERLAAYRLGLAHIPDESILQVPIQHRRDVSNWKGVVVALEEWRSELQQRIDQKHNHP